MSTDQTTETWYLVSFGSNGMIGCFACADAGNNYERGMEVLLQTERGEERGTILQPVVSPEYRSLNHSGTAGHILRRFHPVDKHATHEVDLQQYYDESREIVHSLFLPVQVVDVEQIQKPATMVLHIVQFGRFDEAVLVAELERRWNRKVQLLNLTNQESLAESEEGCSGCDSGSCGKENCGQCSCSSHSESHQQFQQDWQNYLAQRRTQVSSNNN